MKKSALFFVFIFFCWHAFSTESILTPEKYFKTKPGVDGFLLDYEQLISYLKTVDEGSENVLMVENGYSPMGKKMYILFLSSTENIKNLETLKHINRELALNPNLTPQKKESYLKNGKIFILLTLSMHSGEVAPTQALPLFVYDAVTGKDPDITKYLEKTVMMFVPNHNPDGMDMIINHYRKYKGTKWEGSSMPGVYHKYVGHDNNRDFITLTQSDTASINKIFSTEWFPQVMVEKHQMGQSGPRYFVPSNHDPIAENINEELWTWMAVFGANLSKDMTRDGCEGVASHWLFDNYWPGSTETCLWKNTISMLTEAASCNYASPVYVEPNELTVRGKGLSEYKKSVNMPDPWMGGWWHLSDIIRYERSSLKSILKTAAENRQEILSFRNKLCINDVKMGNETAPYYYILPEQQNDISETVHLVSLLQEHGIQCYTLKEKVEQNGRVYDEKSIIIPLAQPSRSFIKEVMEKQKFPLRHYTPDGEVMYPYDITSWSLPYHRGVNSYEINNKIENIQNNMVLLDSVKSLYKGARESWNNGRSLCISPSDNDSYKAVFRALKNGVRISRVTDQAEIDSQIIKKGAFFIDASDLNTFSEYLKTLNVRKQWVSDLSKLKLEQVKLPRIALMETWFHDMDAGWTRYVFDSYSLTYTILKPEDIDKTNLKENFDVLIFPSSDKNILLEGKYKRKDRYFPSSYPPEFSKGFGKKGLEKIWDYVQNGGNIISWGSSSKLFFGIQSLTEGENTVEFELPVSDISDNLKKNGLNVTGSLLNIKLRTDHPITYGLNEEVGVFSRGAPVFSTHIPGLDMDRRVIGVYNSENVLISGYIEKEELVHNKSAIVWARKGKGQLVFFAFNPQFRASTAACYKLLFNSILLK